MEEWKLFGYTNQDLNSAFLTLSKLICSGIPFLKFHFQNTNELFYV